MPAGTKQLNTLRSLEDVDLSALKTGDLLKWNEATQKFTNTPNPVVVVAAAANLTGRTPDFVGQLAVALAELTIYIAWEVVAGGSWAQTYAAPPEEP